MARYLVVEGSFWDGSRIWQQGEVATVPDAFRPSKRLLPLDKAAQAALAKEGVQVPIHKLPPPPEPTDDTMTFREAAEGRKRTSDQ